MDVLWTDSTDVPWAWTSCGREMELFEDACEGGTTLLNLRYTCGANGQTRGRRREREERPSHGGHALGVSRLRALGVSLRVRAACGVCMGMLVV